MKNRVLKVFAFGSMGLLMPILVAATLIEKLYGTHFALKSIYYSPWFIALWSLLAVSAMTYTLRVSRRATLIMLHASFIVILCGALVSFLTSQHGNILLAKEAVPASMFTTDEGKLEKLPFTLQIADIDTIYSKNDDTPSDYRAHIFANDRKDCSTLTASLNNPIKFKDYSFCIKGAENGNLSLLVTRDTFGIPISYTGYLMMFVSFIMLFIDKRSGFRNILQQLKGNNNRTATTRRFIFDKRGILLATTTIIICTRWYRTGVFPTTNGAESLIFLAWATLAVATILGRYNHHKFSTSPLLVLSVIALIAGLAGIWNGENGIQPILRSPLLGIHVTTIIIAYALLCCTAINAVVALCSKNNERVKTLTLFGRALLYPATMLLATGIFIGAIWANISWGRYWGWDPKEVWALVTLIGCSFVFHTRSLPFIAKPLFFHRYCILLFLLMLFTYLGVNLLLDGMHSYM